MTLLPQLPTIEKQILICSSEEEDKFKGVRLFLTKVKEEKDSQKIEELRRKEYPQLKGKEYLVYFRVDKVLPLVGAGAE